MGEGFSKQKQKVDITTPTKEKGKGKKKKGKKDKDAINGNTGVEEVSIQEKKDDAETIQVQDNTKVQEAESSKKGETDSTGSGNAPTDIVEDSPDKEPQKVAQLSDVQSPSEPSVSPVEVKEKELVINETVPESEKQSSNETEVKPVQSQQEISTEAKAEVTESVQPSAVKVEVKAPEPVAEVEAEAPVPIAAVPEPVTEAKVETPEPVAEPNVVPELVAEVKTEAPAVEVKAEAPKPSVETNAEVQEPIVEVKAEIPEPATETKTEPPQPTTEVSEPVAEVKNEVPEVVESETEVSKPIADVEVIPEPSIEVKAEVVETANEISKPADETKVEPVTEETKAVEPISEKAQTEPVAEQTVESIPEAVDAQITEAVKDLGSPINETSVSEYPTETVVSENVPSAVNSVPVVETKVESPVSPNTQQIENVTEAKSEIVPDIVGDTKDNLSPIQTETISDTLSEGTTSTQDEIKSEESIPVPPPELTQNSDLVDNKSNRNSSVQEEIVTPQSPVEDSHPIENDRLNGHVEEHQVNGIEAQNENLQEKTALVNGEVIGNGPTTDKATLISWKHGGQEVAVCGDFCNWGDNCALVENEGIFSTKIKLPKGQHHFKFFVDGQWTIDENAPVIELEGHGQVNLLVVTEGSE